MAPRIGTLPAQQKAAWLWYFPRDWHGLIDNLKNSGHNIVMPKGGIDDMGGGVPALWDQWGNERLQYARDQGVEPYLFVYSWLGRQFGTEAETNAIVQLCRRFLPRRVVVNAEIETDGMATGDVNAFFASLDSKLVAAFGAAAPAIDNSSVPSWDGGRYGGSPYHNVNYEALSANTAVDWYQNYWDEADGVSGFGWQDGYQRRRQAAFPGKLVVPSWTVGKSVGKFAAWAESAGYTGIAGWEAGNGAYNLQEVAAAFPRLTHRIELVAQRTATEVAQGAKAALLWAEYNRLKLFNSRAAGLPRREGVADLSQFGLDAQARTLATEKQVLWSDGQQVDYFHRGQYENLLAAGKVTEY